ncbi:phosphatase 2C-like domain-containing protein [Dissophora ornata]|nr:phosphatase 2C-like domain-containing protein [Dissophora ornata]
MAGKEIFLGYSSITRFSAAIPFLVDGPVGRPLKGQSAAPKARSGATPANAKRKPRQSSEATNRNKKSKAVSGWRSDTLSSDSSEDDTRQHTRNGRHHTNNNNQRRQRTTSSSKRNRTGSPSASASSRSKAPARRDSLPNGLKKLPKGYVYDTEINQAALMNLSVNPSQTGEYMRHLKGKNAQENDFPDRRGEYGVDLNQEPSMFALEQQTGYTYPRLRNSGRERLPKGDCEDGYAIADLKHNGGFLGRLFCITDGHGGRACSSFVIATIPGAMQVILGKYKPSDLSLPSVQELVKVQITEAIRLIDKEYLDYKKQQYLLFKSKQIPDDPGSDGTTLIVNVFIDKWIICLNLGDSRTMMGSRDAVGRWNVDFYSEDHTPSLERLAQTIYANGGEFVTHDDKVIRFDPALKNDKKHRQSLKEARIRVKDAASNAYGIPYMTKNGHCASVNLGACIGDVLYKLDPANPVLGCKPDITFIDVTDIQQGFLLMASDGLWDYVQRGGKVQDQNATVCQFVGDKLDRGWNHQRIVYTLSDRESACGLYSDSIQEYDDFTAILVTFNKQQLLKQQHQQQEYEQRQILLHHQRIQEQQIMLLQQQHQKQREEERLQRLKQLQIQKEQAELEQLEREKELQRKAEDGNRSEDDTDSDLTEPEPDLDSKMAGTAAKNSSRIKVDSASVRAQEQNSQPMGRPKTRAVIVKQDFSSKSQESVPSIV